MQSATAPSHETSAEVHLGDLQRAVRIGDLETVRVILSVEPQLAFASSRRGGSLLLEAHEREHTRVAESFLLIREQAGGLDLDIHEAAALARPDAVRAALADDPSSAAQAGPAGFHALHRAAFAGDQDSVTLLLEAGADANVLSENGGRLTPLHSAVAGAARASVTDARRAVVRLLLAAGGDLDLEMAGGWTVRQAAENDGLAELLGEGSGEESPPLVPPGPNPANASEPPT